EPERLGVGAGAPGRRRGGPALGHQPPETGGSTATSSVSVTASVGSAGSPLSQTFEESTTAENRSPKRPRAASMTSPTVPPGSSTRPVPAASRAAAKSRSVATSSKCRGAPSRPRSPRRELVGQQLEQHVVAPGAVGAPLVAAHHAHLPEPDRAVDRDGPVVGHRRVDDEPVVPPLLDEVAGEGEDGVAGVTVPVVCRVDEQVES